MSTGTRELLRFLLVGSVTVGIDYVTYRVSMHVGAESAPAKAIGFVAGLLFAYVANRLWTFQSDAGLARSISSFAGVYATTLIMNVIVNQAFLEILGRSESATVAAFLVATGISATLNFLGMKFVVFRRAAGR